jgi:hypothetical protein
MSASESKSSNLEGSFYKCILLDPFHAMKRITELIPFSHVYHDLFVCALQDAIFTIDPHNLEKVEAVLMARNLLITFEKMMSKNPDWVCSRIWRRIFRTSRFEVAIGTCAPRIFQTHLGL